MNPSDGIAINTPVWVLKIVPGFWGGWTSDNRCRVGLANTPESPVSNQEAIVPHGWVTPRA